LKAAAGSFERLMLPRLNSIDGELKAISSKVDAGFSRIDGRIDSVEKSVSALRSELKSDVRAVETKVSELDKRLSSKLDQVDRKLDIDRRITIMEAKIKDLEKRS
jgi:predicted RNase H-like nuclease (RuvC/YqgF family)